MAAAAADEIRDATLPKVKSRVFSIVSDESENEVFQSRPTRVLTGSRGSFHGKMLNFAFLKLKKLVSKKKRRHCEGGYDLDLTCKLFSCESYS